MKCPPCNQNCNQCRLCDVEWEDAKPGTVMLGRVVGIMLMLVVLGAVYACVFR